MPRRQDEGTDEARVTLPELAERLRAALAGPLPGSEAHLLLAPRPRPGWLPGQLPPGSRSGAALLLLYPRQGRLHLLLTVRAQDLPHHRGQVSLPGGAVEDGEGVADAALREAREETGVKASDVQVLGLLTPLHLPASRYVVHPVVAIANRRPSLEAAEREVARIVEVPLEDLMDPARLGTETRETRRGSGTVPFFDLGGEQVWGATAMILAEFLWLLGVRPDPSAGSRLT